VEYCCAVEDFEQLLSDGATVERRNKKIVVEHISHYLHIFGRPFVKRFTLCYRTVVLSVLCCLPITLVYCGQMVGQIKMKLGMEVGLSPGDIALDGDPAAP